MKRKAITAFLILSVPAALAAGDARRGAELFQQCLACHSVQPGEHLTGPSLAHVWNRKAATVEGFTRYSEALMASDVVWNAAALDRWLASPPGLVPGTSMIFPGIKEPQRRQDLIAYLQALAEDKAPPVARGGMMSMQPRRADLKSAPVSSRVRSIRYCGDTYRIETGDGKAQKMWEFNLRFKTDSSELGPLAGQPVMIGAGMMGDRASIVFASPREISQTIQQQCP